MTRDFIASMTQRMSEQQEERLRAAARAWLAAGDEVAAAVGDGEDPAVVMERAERATLARLALRRTLVELGWTPPARRDADRPG